MNTPDIHELPLDSIEVAPDRARDLDPAWAEALAALIGAQGLLQPIIARPINEGEYWRYRLVAGLHRLEAFRLKGLDSIPAFLSQAASDDEARLEEVMENLGRYELIALDRCRHLVELKGIHDRKYPKASKGGGARTSGKSFPTGDESPEVFGFAASVADKIGLSKRAINMAVKIWTEIVPTVRAKLPGTALATKMTELKALSELTAPRQVKVIDLIQSEDHPEIKNIAEALAFLEGGVQSTPLERKLQALREGFKALPDPSFDRIVSENADRMIASLQRLGRI
jgi:ParB family chromosome partitioning protein